ncbi:MAG: hypothetical protein H6733_17920 [Alphaproteobacteria bacterium]|nr:hypothetical protein [Alphaproteobacteria bacterium]
MFIRKVHRTRKDGTVVTYLQLVESYRDSATRSSRTRVIAGLGRTDRIDYSKIQTIVSSLAELLPAGADDGTNGVHTAALSSVRTLGPLWVLHDLWHRAGAPALLARHGDTEPDDPRVVMAFAIVAYRALETHGIPLLHWANQTAWLPTRERFRATHVRDARAWLTGAFHALRVALRRIRPPEAALDIRVPDDAAMLPGWPGAADTDGFKRLLASNPTVEDPTCTVTWRDQPPDGPTAKPWLTVRQLTTDAKDAALLGYPGRYRIIEPGLQFKEIRDDETARTLLVQVGRRATTRREERAAVIASIEVVISEVCPMCGPTNKAVCCLEATPKTRSLVTRSPDRRVVVDPQAVSGEERVDGRFVVRTTSQVPGEALIAAIDCFDRVFADDDAHRNEPSRARDRFVDALLAGQLRHAIADHWSAGADDAFHHLMDVRRLGFADGVVRDTALPPDALAVMQALGTPLPKPA